MNDFTTYGWVRLHRQLTNSDMWLAEPFTKGQAWVDLFTNACHTGRSFWVRGNEVKLERGQLGWSEVTLSERWRWSRDKTRRFLKSLEQREQIRQQKSRITSVITIVNYDRYQADIQQTRQQTIQQKDNRQDTYKNEKNGKKIVAEAKIVETPEVPENARPTKMPKDEQALSLAGWAEKRRGFKFTSIPAQLGAIGRAKRAGVSPTRLKNRWEELENETWRNGFDWVDVVKSFDKRA